jgi:DNA replication protein DnaC
MSLQVVDSLRDKCPICRGAEALLNPDGKIVACPCSVEVVAERIYRRLLGASCLPSLLQRIDLTQLEPRAKQGEAYQAAVEFSRNPHGFLILWGPKGTGKTTLAAGIANALLHAGQGVMFLTGLNLLNHLRATFSPTSEITYDELSARANTVPVLVLDDYGRHKASEWAMDQMFNLINNRYNEELPTVITSNLHPDKTKPEAASARMVTGHRIQMRDAGS